MGSASVNRDRSQHLCDSTPALDRVGVLKAGDHLWSVATCTDKPQDAPDVGASFRVGWHPAKPLHCPFARIVGGQRETEWKAVEQRLEITGTGFDIGRRIERIL